MHSIIGSISRQLRGDLRLCVTLYTHKQLYDFDTDDEFIYHGYELDGDYVIETEVIDVDYIPGITSGTDNNGDRHYLLSFRPGDNPNMGFYDGYQIYWYDRDDIDVDQLGQYQLWSDREPRLELMPI